MIIPIRRRPNLHLQLKWSSPDLVGASHRGEENMKRRWPGSSLKNVSSSKYNDAIVTFCKFGTWCRSKNCSIWNIHVIGSFPSNFLMSILGSWIPLGNHPWLLPVLESNPPGVDLLNDGFSKWELFLSSWVPWPTLSSLGSFSSGCCISLIIISILSTNNL